MPLIASSLQIQAEFAKFERRGTRFGCGVRCVGCGGESQVPCTVLCLLITIILLLTLLIARLHVL